MDAVPPWQTVRSARRGDFRIFRVRQDFKISPQTGREHDFFVLECPDWVNVIALTPDRRMVLVEQWRHGSETVELEIPGGVMDAEDEDPVQTGVRELREETGYEGEEARLLASILPNPAMIHNRCHVVLVENCALRHATAFDEGEFLLTRLYSIEEVWRLAREGRIRNAMVLAALYRFALAENLL